MIPFLIALTFPIILTLVFVIPGAFLLFRWLEMFFIHLFNIGDMKVPTFYATENEDAEYLTVFLFPVVGVVFGGIHCAGWFFDFPSSDEVMLWRVSSVVLTVSAILLPLLGFLLLSILSELRFKHLGIPVLTIILLVYVVSRLILLVEAFISLRHLTPGMLALVKWTSFIPHI